MNPHDLRMSLVEWTDRASFKRLPNGKHIYECPLCGQPTRREDFEGYIEIEHHLVDVHYNNIREIDGKHIYECPLVRSIRPTISSPLTPIRTPPPIGEPAQLLQAQSASSNRETGLIGWFPFKAPPRFSG